MDNQHPQRPQAIPCYSAAFKLQENLVLHSNAHRLCPSWVMFPTHLCLSSHSFSKQSQVFPPSAVKHMPPSATGAMAGAGIAVVRSEPCCGPPCWLHQEIWPQIECNGAGEVKGWFFAWCLQQSVPQAAAVKDLPAWLGGFWQCCTQPMGWPGRNAAEQSHPPGPHTSRLKQEWCTREGSSCPAGGTVTEPEQPMSSPVRCKLLGISPATPRDAEQALHICFWEEKKKFKNEVTSLHTSRKTHFKSHAASSAWSRKNLKQAVKVRSNRGHQIGHVFTAHVCWQANIGQDTQRYELRSEQPDL